MRRCSILSRLKTAEGNIEDYKRLCRFHYLDERPGPFEKIFAIKPAGRLTSSIDSETVGVIVYGMPSAESQLRSAALGGLFSGLDNAMRLSLINKNVRNIQRLIIEPRFRGLGLASRLVQETLDEVNVPIVEATAVMGHLNNFFERAGMQRYEAPMQKRCVQMLGAFGMVGVEEDDLVDAEGVNEKLNNLSLQQKAFIENQIQLFLESYGRRRRMRKGPARTKYVLSKLAVRPVYYFWLNGEFKSLILKEDKDE